METNVPEQYAALIGAVANGGWLRVCSQSRPISARVTSARSGARLCSRCCATTKAAPRLH